MSRVKSSGVSKSRNKTGIPMAPSGPSILPASARFMSTRSGPMAAICSGPDSGPKTALSAKPGSTSGARPSVPWLPRPTATKRTRASGKA